MLASSNLLTMHIIYIYLRYIYSSCLIQSYCMMQIDWTLMRCVRMVVLDDSKFAHDFKAIRRDCQLLNQSLTTVPLPMLHGDHPHGLVKDGQALSCTVQELHTWLGVVAHNGLTSFYEDSTVDNYVSRFLPPEPHSKCQNGTRTRWTGMVSSAAIAHVLEKLK